MMRVKVIYCFQGTVRNCCYKYTHMHRPVMFLSYSLMIYRKYPTVERRHNLIHGKTSSQTITDDNLIQSVFTKLQIGRKTKEVNLLSFSGKMTKLVHFN